MSRATLKAVVTSAVAAEGTFTVPYQGQAQADFTSGQTVTVEVYTREFECAATFGASSATVTWPAGAPYSLPPGEYYIDFDTVGGDPLPADASQAANVADLTDSTGGTAGDELAAVTDTSATDQSAAVNSNFASLAAKQAAITDALKAAGLMASDA